MIRGTRSGLAGKEEAAGSTRALLAELAELQERLYAEAAQALLVVLQALDAGGKDGTIEHVFSGVNPQGCRVAVVQGADAGGARARLPLARAPRHARRAG